jgi:hypothetical protein
VLRTERKKMKTLNNTSRKALKNKMAEALNDDIKMLSAGMKDILLDDLITAFENRVKVINQAQSNLQCLVDFGVKVSQ